MNDDQTTYDALVIGGGFAGATAARELRGAGHSVMLLEARDRIGGRTWLKPNALGDVALEMGGTWIVPQERHVWAEVKRYGLALTEPIPLAWPSTWLVSGHRCSGALPFPAEEIPALERLIVTLDQAAARVDPDRPLADQDLADLDVSFEEYLSRFGLQPAVHEIVAVYFRAYGSAPAKDISALHLIRRIAAAGGSVSEFVMSSSGYRLIAGTTALVTSILDDARAQTRLSSPVLGIRQDAQGVTAQTAGGLFHGRTAVITVPLNVLKHIAFEPALSPGKKRLSVEEVACIGTKVWAVVKGAPKNFFAIGNGAGLDWLASDDSVIGDGVLMVGYGCDADALDITSRADVQRAIRTFLPGAEVLAIASHDWRHDPYSLETWAVFRPGQLSRDESCLRTQEGRLCFAGAHTALRWAGFIDGAIESGIRAAREATALLTVMGRSTGAAP